MIVFKPYLLCIFGITASFIVQARPVSYADGWTLMLFNDAYRQSLHYHYSPTAKLSIGYRLEHWREFDSNLHLLQVNYLAKRWNQYDSQANLYFKSGIGVSNNTLHSEQSLGAFLGFSADWEDRRYFAAYSNRYTYLNDNKDFFQQTIRLGWAPYEGDYGDLHTWLMLQIDHMPENDDQLVATPIVRLFKKVHLAEFGVSSKGEFSFNYIYRF